MARYLEDKVNDIEKSVAEMRAKHDARLPSGIEQRLERVEGIAEGLFRLFGNALLREHTWANHRAAELSRIKKKRKAKPKRRPAPKRS